MLVISVYSSIMVKFKLNLPHTMNIWMIRGIKFCVYIILAILLYKIIKFIIHKTIYNKLSRKYFKGKKIDVIFSIIQNILKYLIAFIAVLLILKDVFSINPALIITATGVIGLAVGFGIQGLLRDLVSGLTILLENQFNIGDYIEFLNLKGKVIDMNIKNVTIKDNTGKIHIISNGKRTCPIPYLFSKIRQAYH